MSENIPIFKSQETLFTDPHVNNEKFYLHRNQKKLTT